MIILIKLNVFYLILFDFIYDVLSTFCLLDFKILLILDFLCLLIVLYSINVKILELSSSDLFTYNTSQCP